MTNWYFPNPFEFDSVSDLFSDFIQVNSEDKSFSYRKLASQLNWPISYLNDLVKQRRNLTVIRAIEFSTLANYDHLQIEKIIFLGIKEGVPDKMKEGYFSTSSIKGVTSSLDFKSEYSDIVTIPHLLLVAAVIQYCKGKLTVSEMATLLADKLIDMDAINKIVDILVSMKHIKKNDDGTFTNLKFDIATDLTEEQMQKMGNKRDTFFIENYLRFCQNPQRPNVAFESFVRVQRKHLQAYADRLIALRNWCIESEIEEDAKSEDMVLLQLNLSFFPAVNVELYNDLMKEKR